MARESLHDQLQNLIWFHPKFKRYTTHKVSLKDVGKMKSTPIKKTIMFEEEDGF